MDYTHYYNPNYNNNPSSSSNPILIPSYSSSPSSSSSRRAKNTSANKKNNNNGKKVANNNNNKNVILNNNNNNNTNKGVKLSTDPQSVAARERRHRISDRFKMLQSLVPGGAKLDTVSMLEQAIQYVKFLKTQVWLHQAILNNDNNKNNNSGHNNYHHDLYGQNDSKSNVLMNYPISVTTNDDAMYSYYDQYYYDLMHHNNNDNNDRNEDGEADNMMAAPQVAVPTAVGAARDFSGYQMLSEANDIESMYYYKRSLEYYNN